MNHPPKNARALHLERRAARKLKARISEPQSRQNRHLNVFKIKTIMVPVDFSPESIKALAYAITFACQFNAKITLLHVVESVSTPDFSDSFPLMIDTDSYLRQCRHRLDHLISTMAITSFVERVEVCTGRSFVTITTTAEKFGIDLIIISTHGYTGIKHALLGSTTERVVQHAHCPVLVVRTHERDFLPSTIKC